MSGEQQPGSERLKDVERLHDIAELDLDSPDMDAYLDDLARRAAEQLDLPIGVVSVVLDEAQYFKAMFGVDGWIEAARGTPVEWSFCRNVVMNEAEFVVENALEDDIMKDSPLVTIEGIRCYAGIPLVTSRGNVVGSFCVKGREERHFTEDDLNVLRGYARDAMTHIESRRSVPIA